MQSKLVKKLCAVVLSGTMMLTILPPSSAYADEANDNFTQAKEQFAKNELEESLRSGIIKGDEKGDLHLDEKITRAEFMAIVNRTLELNKKSDKVDHYKDITADAWYKDDVAKALAAGYISGTSKDTMHPMATLTNEQVYTILSRLDNKAKVKIDTTVIKDFDRVSNWAKEGVSQAVSAGLVTETNGKIEPQKGATRGQVSILLNRYKMDNHVLLFPGKYSFPKAKNLKVLAEDVIIENSEISGDILIAKGIKKVVLTNSKVNGQVIAESKDTTVEGIATKKDVVEEPAGSGSSSSSGGGTVPNQPGKSLLGSDEKMIRQHSDELLEKYLLKGELENGEYSGAKGGFQANGVIQSKVQINSGKINNIEILPYTDGVSDTTSYRVYAIKVLPFLKNEQGRKNIAMMSLYYQYVTDLDMIQDDTALYNKAKELLGKECAKDCKSVPKSAHARMTALSDAVTKYLTHEYTEGETEKMFDAISGATLSASGMARSVGHAIEQSIHDKKTGNDIKSIEIVTPTFKKFFANQKDPLRLDELKIKRIKKDGTTEEIGVNEFEAKGVEMYEEESKHKITNGMIMKDYDQAITVIIKDTKSARSDKFDIIVNEDYDENWVVGMQYKVEGKDWENVPSLKMQELNHVNPYQVNNIAVGQVVELNEDNANDYIGKKVELRLVLKNPSQVGNEASKYVPLYTNLQTKEKSVVVERGVEHRFNPDKTAYKSLNVNFIYKITFNAPKSSEPETPGIEDYTKVVKATLIKQPKSIMIFKKGDMIDPSLFAIELEDEDGAKEVINGNDFGEYTDGEIKIAMTPAEGEALSEEHHLKKVTIEVTVGKKTFTLESQKFMVVQ